MKGYKIFCSDWTCRDLQYRVGETVSFDGEPVMCTRGYHFCERALDCLSYYVLSNANHYAEVQAVGDVVTIDDKSVTNSLTVVREISFDEFCKMCTGEINTTFPNGNRTCRSYILGNLHGLCTEYYADGTKKSERHYRQGMLHGRMTMWSREGFKCLTADYVSNELSGDRIEWGCDGNVKSHLVYSQDRKVYQY